MKWKKIVSGASGLAFCSAIAKLLGAFFRIPLTNIIGAEGIGLYQMVFPLYTVLLTISSGGLSTAISKLTATKEARGDHLGSLKILRVSLSVLLILAGIASIFLIIFRHKIAFFQGNQNASTAYLGIAPSIIFVAVIASLRGYFQGKGNMLPSGISQIMEQFVKLILGLYFSAFFLRYSVSYAVFGALLGISLSELSAMFYLLIHFYLSYSLKRRTYIISYKRIMNAEISSFKSVATNEQDKTKDILYKLYRIAIPVTLGSLIIPLTQLIDSVMVINVLSFRGMSKTEATSLFGLVSGPISSLINLPLVVTLAISIAILPKLVSLREREGQSIQQPVNDAIRQTLLICIPCVFIFFAFSKDIVTILYSRGLSMEQIKTCSVLLKIESFSILFVGLIQLSTSILQSNDLAHRPAINLLYGAVVKVLLTLLLLPVLGIIGAAAASVFCYITTALVDLFYMRKVVKPKLNPFKAIILPIFASTLLFLSTFYLTKIFDIFLTRMFSFIISLFIGGIIYILFLLITKAVKIKEIF